MNKHWIREEVPAWDAAKQRIIGQAPAGIFDLGSYRADQVVPGEWWRVEVDGQVVGFGWMDVVWGDGEILLAVAPDAAGQGIGTWILDHLESEAAARGMHYVYNSVSPDHPQRARVSGWLREHGFAHADRGDRLQRQVRPSSDT